MGVLEPSSGKPIHIARHSGGRTLSDVMATDVLQVWTATATREAAIGLAQSAVQAGLAASAQIHGPAASVFWHHGEFGTGEEWTLLLKTTVARYLELEAHLIANHPWTNPEVAAVQLSAGSTPYLEWIRRTISTREDEQS